MTRGGGGEVKTRQAEPGGDGGVRGVGTFSSKKPGWGFEHIQFCNQHLVGYKDYKDVLFSEASTGS